ncbi:hypothetical protein HZA44_00360 [Candidatus Peregrinibacteria bacterium]|nr:hypothetical protein [Candidatus Peregrinibacteria bacterium]
MLDKFDGFVSNGIRENGLQNLQMHKPTILNLDDFEHFWKIAKPNNAVDQFAECIEKWDHNKQNKGGYHFNFLFFMNNENAKAVLNGDFLKFFNFQSFMESVSPDS